MMLAALFMAASNPNNQLGDVNCDGSVDINDVTSLIDYLLGQDIDTFSSVNADTDRDGNVAIADVTRLIDYLLGSADWNTTETFTANGVQFTMVKVEGGTFTMGATAEQLDECEEDELPAHEVTLSSYSIGQTEVTQELWIAVMGKNPSWFQYDSHHSIQQPVENVGWNDCQEFIAKLSKLTGRNFRLPTEAEWEFAARGGNLSHGYKYAGSNTLDDVAWYVETDSAQNEGYPEYAPVYNSAQTGTRGRMAGAPSRVGAYWNPILLGVLPVATKQPNELGLYDMSGNACEWVQDWYGVYSDEAQTDPKGPLTGERRVCRGGQCDSDARDCRVSNRESSDPFSGFWTGGLRLALDDENTSKFHLSETVVQVLIGKSKTVNILNGHGNYSVGDGSDLVIHQVNGNALTVTGQTPGVTTIRVTDNTTGETTDLPVIVYLDCEVITGCGTPFRMISVEGGSFMMGATAEQADEYREDEQPPHEVTVSSFYIGESEVPQYLWSTIMGNNPSQFHLNPPQEMPMREGDVPYSITDETFGYDRPVEQVSWYDCQLFIAKLNKATGRHFRMPTEAEWEFAARGGNLSRGYKYAGSDSISAVTGWAFATDIVPSGLCNELGLRHMSGNLREWCQDWYGSYNSTAQTDPTGPMTGTSRVLRGGCWNGAPMDYRVSSRGSSHPDYFEINVGLRLVLDAEDSPKFRLSETVTEIEQYNSQTIDIINGNGHYNYTVTEGAENVAITMSGNTLTVNAIATGIATINVTDQATGASALLVVVVPEKAAVNETITVNGVSFRMIAIMGSVFKMGSDRAFNSIASENEEPVHKVKLSNYSIGQTEVTQALWTAVMGNNPSYFTGDQNRPVENVSWNDCQVFITKLNELTGRNFRLPTEAEWEYAARGVYYYSYYYDEYNFEYSGSNFIERVAWYYDNSYAVGIGDPNYGTHPVGTKSCNLMELYDMSGNVWEWCQDWYGAYSSESQTNPTGPATGSYRVMRGGSWCNSAKYNRVACRNYSYPSYAEYHVGLRLAL